MIAPRGTRPLRIEVMDEDMVRMIRAKTGVERLQIASGLYAGARQMLLSHLRFEHPAWDEQRVGKEAARRLSHGAA